jgi:predicted transcriptional regulator of viral defense system
LRTIGEEPIFSSSLLLTRGVNPADVRRQLSRWVRTGKLIQLRRSLYMPAEPYRKQNAHPFLLANRMKEASYVSLQSALAYYGLIPEAVHIVTSVTTGRPEKRTNAAGHFYFNHIKKDFFSGYLYVDLRGGQNAFVATPEKALLDLIYITPGADNSDYLSGLRIQHPERFDLERLNGIALASSSAKLKRAAERLSCLLQEDEYYEL